MLTSTKSSTASAGVLLFAVIAALASRAQACSCFRVTFKQAYCASTVAVRAQVIAQADNCPGRCDAIEDQGSGQIVYIARVQQTFRGKQPEDKIMILKTAVNSALCGVRLVVGASYLFRLRRGEMNICPGTTYNIGLCDFPILWKNLAPESKRFVFRNARTGQRLCRNVPDPFP